MTPGSEPAQGQGRSDAQPGAAPALSVVVVAFGAPRHLERCVSQVAGRYPVTVVDNSSSVEIRRICERLGARYIDPGRNLGFAAGVNRALARLGVSGKDFLLLNPDAVVDVETVERLRDEMRNDHKLACVAPAQHADGAETYDRVCWPFTTPLGAWIEAVGLGRLRRRCDYVIGSILLVRGSALEDVGGLDERFFLYAEEQDWQRRARLSGWKVGFCRDASALHAGAGTQPDRHDSELRFHTAIEIYIRKWNGGAGWAFFRAATVVRAAIRVVVRRGARRREALELGRLYFAGPERAARNEGAVPSVTGTIPDFRAGSSGNDGGGSDGGGSDGGGSDGGGSDGGGPTL